MTRRLNHSLCLILVILLSACAQTPQDLKSHEPTTLYKSSKSVNELTQCILASGENLDGNIFGSITGEPNKKSVQFRVTGGSVGVISLVEVENRSGIREIKNYITPNMLGTPVGFSDKIVKPCL